MIEMIEGNTYDIYIQILIQREKKEAAIIFRARNYVNMLAETDDYEICPPDIDRATFICDIKFTLDTIHKELMTQESLQHMQHIQ